MGSWTIYSKNGVAKAVVKELELHDEWMAECFLTLTINSATPIQFAVGDYIDYRNERYTIEYDPNVIKRATSGTYGEGFVYDGIKFVGSQDEIVRCDFNDIVLSDNNVHYTALPTFPFYCESVDDLLDRIQANLEDLYPNQWIVIGLNTVRNSQRGSAVGRQTAFENAYKKWIDPDMTPHTDPYGKQSVAESADNITCWDALAKVHEDFGLNFIVRGKVVVVGTAGVFTANTFQYGKGNGLKEIEKVSDSSQQIVTRLRAYGSETNLPLHYYSAINMLPYGNVVAASATGLFQIDVAFKKEYFVHEFSSGETDVVAKVGDVSYNAKAYINSTTGNININIQTAVSVAANTKVYITEGVKRDMWPNDHKDYSQDALPENMAVSRLMLPMFPNQSLYDWVKAHRDAGTTYNDETGLATYHGITAYFSKESHRPYIDSLNKAQYGVRPASIYFDGSNETEDIHPTIEGMTYNNVRVDAVYAADQIEDNGVYDDLSVTVPNFHITLPDLGFNLAEVYEENASIDMKDGMCGGRSFKLAAKPTQDSNGRWVCEVQREKDDNLNLFFPYCDFQISSGDHYVLTGIQMPDAYIEAAAVKLLGAALDALQKNEAPRFTYQPKIDKNFMQRQHDTAMSSQGVVSLHDTLKAGDVFVFADADMGVDASIIIDVLTIKENGDNGIPTYEVTLRDEKQVSIIQKIQNKIDSVINGAININSGVGGLTAQQVRSLINNYGGEQFLSKLNNDTAAGYITMLKGLQIGANFVPDILGEGGVLRMRQDGKVELVTDILYARVKAYFDSVEIREYQHTGGNRIASVAGNKICRVAWFNSSNVELEQTQANLSSVAYFRCYFRASDGEDTVRNNWVIGDLAYCHVTSIVNSSDNPEQKGLNQKHLWRLVIGRNTEGTLTEDGEAYIDLSNRSTETISGTSYTGYQSGSDAPEAQDDIIQLGNVNDTTRQGAIVEFVTGTDAPSYQIYQGINSFSLNNKNQIGFGYNTSTGRAYLNVYGDAYVGARDRSTFIEYKQSGTGGNPELNIKAHVEFTNSDAELDALVQEHQRDDSYDDTEVRGLINGLQEQIDGQVESWFFDYPPVHVDEHGAPDSKVPLNVAPYSDWTDDNAKIAHLGDTFTDNSSGYCWRFTRNENTNAFEWTPIEDSAIISALQNAARAQDTADHKRRVFLTQPVPPYDAGDMWANAVHPANYTGATDEAAHKYNNDILKCVTSKASDGSFSINDWTLASKYTDDSKFNGYIDAMLNGTGLSGDSAAATAQKAILSALGVGTVVAGGLLLSSLIGMRQYNGSGDKSDVSNYTTWAGISGQYNANVLGGGMAAWYGGGMVDKETLTEPQISQGWDALRWAKGVDRFDGSGYRADGNITWDETGALTIKNITTLSDSNNNNILNELATFNSAFTFGTSGQGSTTALYITPNVPFQSLYIGTSNANKKEVATQEWVGNNYVSTAFFRQLFRAFKPNATAGQADVEVQPNTIDATISNIKAMVGFWTEQYVSALGNNSDSGGGGASVLYGLNDVTPNATGDGVMGAQDGYVLTYNGSTHHWYAAATAETYVLPQATSGALGGIKIGYAASGKNYAIALDANGKAYVNVPWTDNDTWIAWVGATENAAGTAGYMPAPTSAQRTQFLRGDGTWQSLNNYSLPLAASGVRGGVQVGYTTDAANRNYAVQLSSEKMYVNVPWTDTVITDYWKTGDTRTANYVLAAPNGQNGAASFRALVAADIPDLSDTYATDSRVDTLEGYFTNGVANKATQLNTSRTLWGQSFDGSANITGNMSDVGSITADGFRLGKDVGSYTGRSFLLINSPTGKPADITFRSGTFTDGSYGDWTLSSRGNESGNNSFFISRGGQNDGESSELIAFKIQADGKVVIGQGVGNETATNQLEVVGDLKVRKSVGWSSAPLNVDNSANAPWLTCGNFFAPNLSSGNYNSILIGKNANTNNAAHLSFYYSGNSSTSNRLALAFFNNIDLFVVRADGNVGIGTASPAYKLAVNGTLGVTGAISSSSNITAGSTDGTYVQIGGARIVWDDTNKALKVIQSDNSTAVNFYATGAISALGQGVDGGGGGQGDVTWALLADNTDTRQIAISHLTTALTGYATTSQLSSYLPLSGGALTSSSRNILSLYQNASGTNQGATINFYLNGTIKGSIGYNNSKGFFIENHAGGIKGLWIEDSGNLTYRDNIILDAGNYTSYLGYIGTTAVQASSAVQSLTGIGNIESANFKFGTGISYSTRSALLINSPETKPADLIFRSGTFTTGTWGDWTLSSRSTEGSGIGSNSFVISRGAQNEGTSSENICFKIDSNTKVIIGSAIINTSALAQLHVVGDIYSTTGFKKYGASDTDVLLGGGGHTAISGLSVSYADTAGSATYADSAGTATDDTKILKASDTFSGTHTYDGNAHIFETTGDNERVLFKYTGSATPVPFCLLDASTSAAQDSSDYCTLRLARTNHTNGNTAAACGVAFSLKNASGVLEECATINALNTANGKLVFRGRRRAELAYIDHNGIKGTGFWAGQNHIAGRGGIRINSTGTSAATDILLGKTNDFTQWTNVYWALSARGSGEDYRFSIWRGVALTSENELFVLTKDLNCGIGTTTPSYKLHVNGTFYASGNSSIGGTFGVTGATTLTGLLTANGGIVIPSDNTIKIGDIYLAYDSTNNAIEVYKLDGTNHVAANLYARGGIAAFGETTDGQAGQGDVTWTLLADGTDTRQIALSHLTTALSGYSTTSHTHTTTIATDSGTNQLTLAHGTKYKITAGGTSFVFTMPTDNNTTYTADTGLSLSGTAFSINSTYQTYISHGESAYNSLSNYLPLSGGTTTGTIWRKMAADTSNYENAIGWLNRSGNAIAAIGYHNTVQKVYINPVGASEIYNDAVGKYSLVIGNNTLTYNTKEIATQEWVQGHALEKLDWWNHDDSHSVDSLTSGTTFAYTSHSAPTNGTIVAFSSTTNSYTLQLQGQYSGENLYFRNYNGDNGSWQAWREVLHSGNYSYYALPVSGGSITGNLNVSGTTTSATTKSSLFYFNRNSTDYGYVGLSSSSENHINLVCSSGSNFGIYVNGDYRIRVIQNGNVGIGTTSPTSKLHVNGDIDASYVNCSYVVNDECFWGALSNGIGSSYHGMLLYTYNGTPIVLYNMTNVGIGVLSPSYKLHVDGGVYATGGVTSLSDIRKKDVVSYNLPLNVTQIANAPTIKFLWKDKREEGEQVGTIAQYWQKVLPWVVKDKSNELSMQYGVASLVSAITIAKRVVNHEQRIKELEAECERLRTELSQYKTA